jgi:hypothetical protein
MKKLIALATGIVEPSPEEQKERIDMIDKILKLCDEKNVDPEEVLEKFKVDSLSDMSTDNMRKCIKALEKKEV